MRMMPRDPKGEKRPADVIGTAIMVGRIALSKKFSGNSMIRLRTERGNPPYAWVHPDDDR